jgi:hydrogenase maturation protein HypF
VLLAQRAAGVPAAISALLFHRALVAGLAGWAEQSARRSGVSTVVLAGGCFQNRLLLEGLIEALAASGLQPLWAQQLPCGDGALALGQLVAAQLAAPPQ